MKRTPQKHMQNFDTILSAVRKYGRNNNSFMTLYPGFKYFTSQQGIPGVIAYIDLSHTWVGAAEPIAPIEQQISLLNEFVEAASQAGKSAIFLPVSSEFSKLAKECGFGQLTIGSEPLFFLERYPKTGKTWVDVVPSAKILEQKGARVTEVQFADCSKILQKEFESMTEVWLKSRKMDPLGFLNQVRPFHLYQYKKYFYIELNGKILAFLAAIPILDSQGWYLIDLIRRSETPAGTTELLILSSMKKLRDAGASFVTLGVSPLAQSDSALPRSTELPWLNAFLENLYEKGGWFYNFKSLFQYKLKFHPTRIDPVYLIYKKNSRTQQKMNYSEVINVLQAFCGQGLTRTGFSSTKRTLQHLNIPRWIKTQVNHSIVTRSNPSSNFQLLWRCKFTILLIILNISIYLLSVQDSGLIDPSIESEWGFSWNSFYLNPIKSLFLSPFLHWSVAHIAFNLIFMMVLTGGLEFLAGTLFMSACYLIPMLLSNPMTAHILNILGTIQPNEIDVGASLGIFGCGGALSWYFLKRRWIFILPAGIFTLSQSLVTHHWLAINHWIAIILGISVGKLLLRS